MAAILRAAAAFPCVAALLCGAACGKGAPAGVHPRYDPAALGTSDFFALPWPTDLRRTSTGLDLRGFPNPAHSSTLSGYYAALEASVGGFGQASALYINFDAPIDTATVSADSVQVIDLQSGAQVPLQTNWYAQATLFLPANTLAILPLYGAPLHEGHVHALVITKSLKDPKGNPVQPSAQMSAALSGGDTVTAPFRAFAQSNPAYKDVALASVFTVQDPTVTLLKLRAAVRATPDPQPEGETCSDTGSYQLCAGTFADANFQAGDVPYTNTGGNFVLDASGTPQVQRTEHVRFAFTTPEGAGPFPVVIYEHGTGGDYETFVREGIGPDFAARGIATLSMDQVLHGPRNPSCDETSTSYESCVGAAYFNFLNPYAGRDNTRQGAADGFQILRLAHNLPQLDATRIAFLGHSQGGLTGAPFIAAEPELHAAVTSGTGGTLAITVLVRKDPLDFKALTELLAGISGRESLEPFHPILMLIQTFAEPADPISYGRHFAREPLSGGSRSVVMLEGLLDPYVAPDASEALGAAALFDIGGVAVHESAAFLAKGLHTDPLPVSLPAGNGLLLQFPNDDHFALFDNPVAKCQAESFLQDALAGTFQVRACQ